MGAGRLMLWQSDGNFVKAVFGRDSNSGVRRMEVTSDNPTDVRQIGPSVTLDESFPDTAWIRMYREGNVIGAEFAPDEGGAPGEWQPFASTRPVDVDPAREGQGVQIGLYAGSDIEGAPYEQTAAFDFARFEPDEGEECPEGDTTPPVTTHALDPADPGEGGTYEGAVDVTLSATDPGEGGGEPQTHDVQAQGATWDPDELEAASGDVVTWHFDDPPAQFPHDVWLVPPGGDPAPDGGDIFEVTDGLVPAGGPPVSYTLEEQGTWTFVCRIHSTFAGGEWAGMVGTAEVGPGGGEEPSGVDFTEYRINTDGVTGDWVRSDNAGGDDPFETAFTVSEAGEHEIDYRSTDNAGNVEDITSLAFEIAGEPEPEYCPRSDEFDGDSLNTDRWSVVREDPTRLSVADGALNLVAPALDIFAGDTGLPNIVVQPLPDGGAGPWSITTEMTWSPTQNYQNAGLIVYGDDANYLKTGMVWNGSRNFELIKELNNGATFPGNVPAGSLGDRYFMRLTSSDGNAVTAEFSADGETWTEIGSSNLNGIDDPRIGVYATASTAAGASETTASYHSVAIEPECDEENTPPVIESVTADPESGEAPLDVTFGVTASDPDGDELSYSWDLDGDGTEDSTEESPSHTYADPGEYEALVTVSDGQDDATGSVTVTVTDPGGEGAPQVQGFADPASGPAPLRVRFSATGLDPEGGDLTYRWEFEDGTVLGPNAVHTYREVGEHSATVTATDEDGNTASDEVTVTVTEPDNAAPTVEASVDIASGVAPLRVRFDATGNDPDGPNRDLTYAWEFGDGGTSLARRPGHVYREPGEYTAVVTVTDPGGASATAEVDVTVDAPPDNRAPAVEAAALPGSGTAPLSVLLTAQGSDPDGDRLTYSWELGDGESADGRRVRHTYTEGGTYTAVVTATDPDGATGTAEVEIVVGDPPGNQAPTVLVASDPASGTAPLRVRFTAAGSDPDGDALSYVWEFGDGGMAGGPRATHVYRQPGTYTATVTVTDPSGESGSATIDVVVSAAALRRAAPRPAAPQGVAAPQADGNVAGEQASVLAAVRKPTSVRALRRRGVRVAVACADDGDGRAVLKVARKAARRVGLRKRKLAARTVECATGETVKVRLKPRKAARRKLRGERAVKLVLRVRVDGTGRLSRKLRIR